MPKGHSIWSYKVIGNKSQIKFPSSQSWMTNFRIHSSCGVGHTHVAQPKHFFLAPKPEPLQRVPQDSLVNILSEFHDYLKSGFLYSSVRLIGIISNCHVIQEVTRRIKTHTLLFPVSLMVCFIPRIKFRLHEGKQGLRILRWSFFNGISCSLFGSSLCLLLKWFVHMVWKGTVLVPGSEHQCAFPLMFPPRPTPEIAPFGFWDLVHVSKLKLH